MFKTIKIAALIFGSGLFISCGRQIDCPDFNNEIMDWIPYQSNDTITLVNYSNDSILILVVSDLVIEHTTHYMTNLDCGTCDDHIMINGNELNNDFQINIALNENKIVNQHYIIEGNIFTDYNSAYTDITDYSFGGHSFDAVRIFEKSTSDDRFQKLLIAKGFGIIGLIESKGDTWILEGINTERLNEPVNISYISCS